MPRDHHFADLVFTGGPVYTVDPARSWATAVAVRDGRIVVVGDDHDVEPPDRGRHRGRRPGRPTARPRLPGRPRPPGPRRRPPCAAATCTTWRRPGPTPRPLPPTPRPIPTGTGSPAAAGAWRPSPAAPRTARCSTPVVPDRPVALPNRDGHGLWANSRALELAGITRDTPDPADGRIERDADGEPTGMLQEGAAELVLRADPAHHRGGVLPGPAGGPALPPRLRHHRLAGRRRRQRLRSRRRLRRLPGRAEAGTLTAGSAPPSGGTARADSSSCRASPPAAPRPPTPPGRQEPASGPAASR